jgi:hypothetical protein
VTNIGEHSTWWDTRYRQERVYVSPDAEFHHHRATYLRTVTHPSEQPLQPGESYTTTATVTMPEGYEGEKFLHVFVDRDPRHESIWGGVSALPFRCCFVAPLDILRRTSPDNRSERTHALKLEASPARQKGLPPPPRVNYVPQPAVPVPAEPPR